MICSILNRKNTTREGFVDIGSLLKDNMAEILQLKMEI